VTIAVLNAWKNNLPLYQTGPYRIIGVDKDYIRIVGPAAPKEIYLRSELDSVQKTANCLANAFAAGMGIK